MANKTSNKTYIILTLLGVVIILALFFPLRSYLSRSSDTDMLPATGNHAGTTTTPSSGLVSQIKVFYYLPSDAGKHGEKFGCDDSLVGASYTIVPTQSPLRAAFEKLLSGKTSAVTDADTKGLQNSLYQSSLKIEQLSINNQVATVKLIGTASLGGVCDDPRFVSQIRETVLQFDSIKAAVILINGKPLETYLSEK